MADPATFAQAAAICQRRLDKLQQNTSLSAQVRRIMLEKQNGFPSLNVTARLFHMTRTLHRRLQDEGTSYKDILENVRHMLALEHLKAGHPHSGDCVHPGLHRSGELSPRLQALGRRGPSAYADLMRVKPN